MNGEGPSRRVLRHLRRNAGAKAGAAVIVIFILAAAFAGVLAPAPPLQLGPKCQPPSLPHPLGTDESGRDVLSRLLYGGRISLSIGLISVGIALAVGVPIGAAAGYFGGWADAVLSRMIDIMLAVPGIVLAIVIVSMLGPGLVNVMIAVGVVNVPLFARQIRSSVVQIKARQFVESARAMGASHGRILLVHIMPNVLSPVIVLATLGIGTAILDAAGLNFLGLGGESDLAEWGNMLKVTQRVVRDAPWAVLAPGAAITLTVLAFNLLGDALRDALDPQLRY